MGKGKNPKEQLDHAHRAHAILSASASKQWINCPPSARLQEKFPNESSSYAKEGTFMHEICEYKIRHDYLHQDVPKPTSNEFYCTTEIDQVTDAYYEFVVGVIESMKKTGHDPLVLIEAKLNYTHIAPSGFGTGDMVIVGEDFVEKESEDASESSESNESSKVSGARKTQGVIHVIDFKGGRGVFVDADHNSQMMLYALGALAAYSYLYDVKKIRMTIVQPRLDNISTFECSREELEAWGESIKPIAKLAYEGKGEQKAGDWCKFCRAKPVCKTLADEALALCRKEFVDLDALDAQEDTPFFENIRASPGDSDDNAGNNVGNIEDNTEGNTESNTESNTEAHIIETAPTFKQPELVSLSELEKVLPTLNRISDWIDAVFKFISTEAITHGVPIKGYKVVEGRSQRMFTDIKSVIKTAQENGYTNVYKQQPITLTEFEKMMGKKTFAELLGQFIIKPPGKLSLVPESDPRPAVDMSKLKNTPDQEFEVLPDQEE